MQTIRRSFLPVVLLSVALLLSACGGDDSSDDTTGTTATTDGGGDTGDATSDGAAASDDDGASWSAELTGGAEATLSNSGTSSAFASADNVGDITLIGESATTRVKLIVPLALLEDGGSFDLASEDLGPSSSVAHEGRSWNKEVEGTVTVESVADGLVVGTFEITALNDDDGTTVTATGEFTAELS